MATTTSPAPENKSGGGAYTALRALGYLMLALMVASILYSVWIAIINWGAMGV